MANRLRPFCVDRNIRHFLWYGGVAGDGLRSVGDEGLPSSKSVCSILPIAICGPGLYGAPALLAALYRLILLQRGLRFAPSRCPKPSLTLTPAGLALWGWQTPYRGSTKLRLIR